MCSPWLLWLLLSILSGSALLECPPTSFDHFYVIRNEDNSTKLIRHRNSFPLTHINDFALLKDLCVDDFGLPVVRRCLANSQWEELDQNLSCKPASEAEGSQLRTRLNNLQFEGTSNQMDDIGHILGQAKQQLLPVDVLLVNKLIHELARAAKSAAVCAELIGIYSNLMAADSSVLQVSSRLNATSNLLSDFEDYTNELAPQMAPLDNCNPPTVAPVSKLDLVDFQGHDGVQVFIGNNLSIFYTHPECNNYTGIAIYSEPAPQRTGCRHHRFWYRFLLANQSLESLKAEPGLEAATYLTDHLWQSLQRAGVTHLVFKIYANSALFVDTSAARTKPTPASHVLSINIPQASKRLPHPLVFLLRNSDYGKAEAWLGCGYWNNETWKTNGVRTSWNSLSTDPVVVCYSNHLTQFTFLVGATCMQQDCPHSLDPKRHESMLDATTNVGCALSLFGLLGIWLTAAISRRWRSMQSSQLELNISVAMSLFFSLMLLLWLNESLLRFSFGKGSMECIAIGALFQYSALLLFSWTLFFGIRQYRLFVTVFTAIPPHDVLRTTVIAWLLPLLPTLLVALISPASYSPVQSGDINSSCYPSGSGLIYGVLLPMGLVLSANLAMFSCILRSVCRMNDQVGSLTRQQLRLFILLFFQLGLAWIFAICSYFRLGLLVTFLFCLTGPIQGFVLFIYSVVFNRVARYAWLKLFFGNRQFVRRQLT